MFNSILPSTSAPKPEITRDSSVSDAKEALLKQGNQDSDERNSSVARSLES